MFRLTAVMLPRMAVRRCAFPTAATGLVHKHAGAFGKRLSSSAAGFDPRAETVSVLRHPTSGVEVYIVGTAHVSLKSAEEVGYAVHAIKPHTVVVELCEERARKLRNTKFVPPSSANEKEREDDEAVAALHSWFQGQPNQSVKPLDLPKGSGGLMDALMEAMKRGPMGSFLRDTDPNVPMADQPISQVLPRAAGGTASGGLFDGLVRSVFGGHKNSDEDKQKQKGGFRFEDFSFRGYVRMMYQQFKNMGLVPGLEFKVAMEEAERVGARLVLGDRSVHETVRKLQDAVSIKLAFSLFMTSPKELSSAFRGAAEYAAANGDKDSEHPFTQREVVEKMVEQMKKRHTCRLLADWLDAGAPPLANALLHERDEILSRHIISAARDSSSSKPQRVLAVVGMAHMDGIEAHLEEELGLEVQEL